MIQRYTAKLKRNWQFTPGAEWIWWEEPGLDKPKAFRIVLTDVGKFIEWRQDKVVPGDPTTGFTTGTHDDGEVPGRHKMTPILRQEQGLLAALAPLIMKAVRAVPAEAEMSPTFLRTVEDLVTPLLGGGMD